MTQNMNFTKEAIDRLPIPEKGKRAYYKDTKESGLTLDIRSSGSKSFYLYKKINGKPERIYLGPYPDMKIPEARKACAVKKGEIAKDINPQEEKRKIRQEVTLGDFFVEYMERHSKPNKRTWKDDEYEVKRFLSHWYKRKLSAIQKHEVQKLHESIRKDNGLYMANRILEKIRNIYNKAIEWGWEGANPAAGIRKFKEKARDRFIQPNEMPFLFQALQEEENETARDYILLSLMTGARKSNVLSMRWEQISFERNLWRIPETKNGEPLNLPLIPQAMDLLKQRKEHSKSVWVFEGESGTSHLADPKKSWGRVRYRATLKIWQQTPEYAKLIEEVESKLQTANNYGYTVIKLFNSVIAEAQKQGIELPIGLTDVRLHDIRRTLGSYQAITGASLPIIGKTLGHKTHEPTLIYAHLHDDPVREALEKANNAIWSLGNSNAS